MGLCRGIVRAALALTLATAGLRADSGDIENAHDYPGFTRPPGFVISDYDEDNPAEFDFPVARPLPIDSDHLETVRVRGHRYVIRYEADSGVQAPSLLQLQEYYEKLAVRAGFELEKTGAVGDVTETFHRAAHGHDMWVCLEPDVTAHVLTVVESSGSAPPPFSGVAEVNPKTAAPNPAKPSAPPVVIPAGPALPTVDAIYSALLRDGRVVVPFNFAPGKTDLAADSQPMVDRIASMMKLHSQLFLRIEGHTDNTGDPDDDMRLSALRALAVQAALVDASVEKGRLDAVGVGGLQPIADNHTAEGREKNRRIELVLRKRHPPLQLPAAGN